MQPDSPNCGHRVRPGPRPIFTERMVVQVRPDQRATLDRIAAVLGLTVSDLVRWFVDQGTAAVEAVPLFKAVEDRQ